MYKNIVVPVDVFDAGLADKALSHAKFLAQHSAGQIHLIHVIPAFSPVLTRGFISDARKMEDHLLIQTHLLGSEAANIVRYAHVPVFVVR